MGCSKSILFLWVTPLGWVFKIHDNFLHGFEDILML